MSEQFRELTIESIDEGRLVQEINRRIREAIAGLRRFELDTGDTGSGKAVVSVSIEFKRPEASDDEFLIISGTRLKIPTRKVQTRAKASRDGMVALAAAGGTAYDSPDQYRLFNARGELSGGVDPDTGEAIDPAHRDVAGRVSARA
jgi:hypothetical protein